MQESVRLLGLLSSSACPVRDMVLQAGNLSKVLAYLRTRMKVAAPTHFVYIVYVDVYKDCQDCLTNLVGVMQDSDASVRTACADTVGILAENMSKCSSMPWVGDTASNPVLKLIFELLSDQKREVQSAVCLSLSQVCVNVPINKSSKVHESSASWL